MLRFATHLHIFVDENVVFLLISRRCLDKAYEGPQMTGGARARVQGVEKTLSRHCGPMGTTLGRYWRFCCPARKSSQILYFFGFLKKWKIMNFQFGWKWSQNELLMRSKVQNGSPRSTEPENKLFMAFPAEYPAVNHDMRIMHIIIHGRIFGRDRLKSAFFGFCGPRRPVLHLRTH